MFAIRRHENDTQSAVHTYTVVYWPRPCPLSVHLQHKMQICTSQTVNVSNSELFFVSTISFVWHLIVIAIRYHFIDSVSWHLSFKERYQLLPIQSIHNKSVVIGFIRNKGEKTTKMSTLFHWSEVTGNPDTNYSALQRETCHLISKYCQQFGLDEDIEFTCFELTHKHFRNVQNKILTGFQCFDGTSSVEKSLNEYFVQAMFTIETELPLNLFSIISITAKYFGSRNWTDMYKVLPKMLLAIGKIVSFRELYQNEFKIFRDLDFCVSENVCVCWAGWCVRRAGKEHGGENAWINCILHWI